MADKMSISDLRRAVMVRTGATEQEISTFHNALKEQIVEALRKDKQVKINGLGTFRLQAIAPRKSVNIATMQLYRDGRGGKAVMVVECDQEVPEEGIRWLEHAEGVLKVTYLSLA